MNYKYSGILKDASLSLALTLFIAIDFMPCEKLCNGSGEYMTVKRAVAAAEHKPLTSALRTFMVRRKYQNY